MGCAVYAVPRSIRTLVPRVASLYTSCCCYVLGRGGDASPSLPFQHSMQVNARTHARARVCIQQPNGVRKSAPRLLLAAWSTLSCSTHRNRSACVPRAGKVAGPFRRLAFLLVRLFVFFPFFCFLFPRGVAVAYARNYERDYTALIAFFSESMNASRAMAWRALFSVCL